MKDCDLLLGGRYLLTMDDAGTRIRGGGAAVSGGRILDVGDFETLEKTYRAKKTIFHKNAAVLPGFINAHTHQCLTRGLHEDLLLMDWLEKACYPIERSYTAEDIRAASLMCQAEFIRGGTTTFVDAFRFEDVSAEVLKQSGLRAILTPQMFDDSLDSGENFEKTIALMEQYNGVKDGRIRIWFSPHSPYSCSRETYHKAAELAPKYHAGIHTHLCETKAELDIVRERWNTDPVTYLEEAGVFEVPCILAHCIYLTEDNIKTLAAHSDKAGLVYNPVSNMKLADGVAKVPELLKAGCTVGLGTDSTLSTNSLSMFEQMRFGSYLQKVTRDDATVMPCYQMLYLATRGSAAVLGMDREIGSLEKGKKADIIMISFDAPHMWPVYDDDPDNMVEQIVYSAQTDDVVTTVVDGNVLMDDRKLLTLDAEASFDFIQEHANSLYSRSFPERFRQ